MQRILTAELDLQLTGPVDVILQIAASRAASFRDEELSVTLAGRALSVSEIVDPPASPAGTRIHRVAGDAGTIAIRYRAVVEGVATPSPTSELETIAYLRPSRYAQSDEVFAHARRQFRGLQGRELVSAVSDFVATSTTYAPGLSLGTDSAVTTLASGQGVCRDYAHLVIALLRAMDVPARYAACYAPGLRPMDFHAVAEAYVDGAWHVIDATRLSNRRGLVRIATGRDAADCAFLSYYGGNVALTHLRVDAEVDGGAPAVDDPASDDHEAWVVLA
ncbi:MULTISPECIES: transglutaminase-like domain-containing protein [Microbacterium]|uniref:transglutaminase-like domain-containing protein n=1 Tax=Microbacterium TaxID=33882 RepID=UPI000E722EA9|nr:MULTISPECIES: transglutaminase family protein [Microbacterium]MDF2579846.1 transglutaminase [Microbacterium sp.]RKE60238.1 transglutaminase superfamily protein [Microbacterium sp. AG238]WJM14884.1 transglutaminase family protein [Microbacterium arborescens]